MMRTLTWLLLFVLVWLVTPAVARAQDTSADPLADPVVHGAWLYEGNCMHCHGAYDQARLGEDKPARQVRAEISGEDRQGCDINWAVSRGGPLTIKEIDAIVRFMQAWEEASGSLALPPLPAQPTPTPRPSPTSVAGRDGAAAAKPVTATPTPLPPDLALALDSNPLARGAWLYSQNCNRCHQDYATGRMGIGLDRDRIERTIKSGKSGSNMPAFAVSKGGSLRATDIKLVVNYIETWERLGVAPALPDAVLETMDRPLDPAMLRPIALPTALAVTGNAAQGALLYRAYCTDCHGNAGQGGSGPVLARVWSGVRPDLTLRATIAQGVHGTAMRGWVQAQGGPLEAPALNDLVAHLLALPPTTTSALGGESTAGPAAPSPWQGWPGVVLLLGAAGVVMWRSRRR